MKLRFFPTGSKHQILLLAAVGLLAGIRAFAEGGVSGGGGHLLFPVQGKSPLPRSAVERELAAVHGRVVSYLVNKEQQLRRGELPAGERAVFEPLFQQPRDVIGISARTSLDFEDDHPCFDSAAAPADASTISDHANSICVSSFTIAKKVDPRNLGAESAAILVHEFSELAGFGEEEAVKLQTQVFADYKQGQF